MTKQEVVMERRKELLIRSATEPLEEVVADLALKYHTDDSTIYGEWADKESWAKEIVNLDDPALSRRYFAVFDTIIAKAMSTWLTCCNANEKTGCLRVANEAAANALRMLVASGYFTKEQAADQYDQITIHWLDKPPAKDITNVITATNESNNTTT